MRPQQPLIDHLTTFLSADERVLGAWLSGSLGKDEGDEWSDIDLIVLVDDGRCGELVSAYEKRFAGETVYARPQFGRLLNAITPDWQRFDLFFVERKDLARFNPTDVTLLFAKTDDRPSGGAPPAEPSKLEATILEFIRVLGLAPVALGRGEYVLALEGAGLMRRMLVDLMMDENGVTQAQRGGALKLNRFLTAEQRAELEALPPMSATRESANATNVALARAFLPRAKRLAHERGLAWPQAYEDAMRAWLDRALGLQL